MPVKRVATCNSHEWLFIEGVAEIILEVFRALEVYAHRDRS